MPNAGALQSFSVSYVNDGQLTLTYHTGSSGAERVYFSRWNQADNSWGGEFYTAQPGGTSGQWTYQVTDIAPNRTYQYRARGWRSDGGTGFGPYIYSNYVQTSPRAPINQSAGLSGPGAINLYWTDGCYEPYYSYETQIWISVNGAAWGHYTTRPAGEGSYAFTGLAPGATYQFGVRHRETNGGLVSGMVYTGVLTATDVPATPGAITATRNSDAQATLSWTNNSNSGAPYDSLTLQRWDNVGNAWSTIANLGGGATTATDSGLVAGRKYQWRILANNAVGSSGWSYSGNVFTTPQAPSNVVSSYVGGTTVRVTWTNNVSYSEYGIRLQPYKNGVADGAAIVLNGGTTSYDVTSVDNTASYYFKTWAVSNTGSLASAQTQSNSVTPAAAPNAPTNLNVSPGSVLDVSREHTLSWVHSPSTDGSAQTKRQLRHRLVGGATWTEDVAVATAETSIVDQLSTWGYTNGQNVEWQVRTWGVHVDPSPYSSTSTVQLSTTPVVTITSPDTTITTSVIDVAWSYFDQETTTQTEWRVDLIQSDTGQVIERQSGADTTSATTMAYSAQDGVSYRVEVTVRDSSGLWSDKAVKTFSASFLLPAPVDLLVDLDGLSGSGVLNLTRTPDDGGVTTFPASAVTIERQFWDPETETYSDWEVLVNQGDPDAVYIDTTAPTHDDGQYRVITYSSAPSSVISNDIVRPAPIDNRWLYVSGGPNFEVVCKMWANIEIEQTASRSKALHYFAGRRNPVIYSGEAAERTYSVTGILEEEASPPSQWVRLARQAGPVLFRAPGRRMFGSLSEVSIERIQNNLHKVSFSIQEVSV